MSHTRGRPIDTELREKIAKLFKAGHSQVDIARMVGRATGTISHHIRALRPKLGGQWSKPKKYKELLPVKHGKRECVTCHVKKTPGAFPGDRNAECTMCVRAKKGDQ